jgi:hypothetical protein
LTPGSAQAGSAIDDVDVVGPEVQQSTSTIEVEAQAISNALQLMMDHPDDFGYPWFEPSTRRLSLSAASDEASALAEAGLFLGVEHDLREARYSYAELQSVATEVIDLNQARRSDAWDLIWQIEPDHRNNRMILNVVEATIDLRSELATRFGDAVAVRVQARPNATPLDNRQNDPSTYLGGAQIYTPSVCSDGFARRNGTLWYGLLTAAHCIPNGGTVTCCSPAQTMGSVLNWSHENWEPGVGTVGYSGSSINRGDVALVKLAAGRAVSPSIWRGGPTSSTTSVVRLVWARWSQNGDSFCTGGRSSGELCGWTVGVAGIDTQYNTGEWVRNVAAGYKSGTCASLGDSGGSVFTLYGDGVAAKGIISGLSDFLGCTVVFTDIQNPVQGLPGGIWASP